MTANHPAPAQTDGPPTSAWGPDLLGDEYRCRTIELGPDPDGEGEIAATLVRREGIRAAHPDTPAVLYVHGFTDYFFQTHLADFFADRGNPFYALDLRKCGRSRRTGQSAHFVSDLAFYDAELDEALRIVRSETGRPVLVMAHSTGGLAVPLWLDRVNRRPGGAAEAGIVATVLNSPWFDLHGPAYHRTVLTPVVKMVGRVAPFRLIPGLTEVDTYGVSLHRDSRGEWEYELEWKPLSGFPVRFGWLRAIRRGHAQLHRGLDIGVPALVLRSTRTRFTRTWSEESDTADTILDVAQIQKWSGCLGGRTVVVPIDGARHDVFLSIPDVRATAFAELAEWLDRVPGCRPPE
ncbi:MAG: alpha/beta hydrolase [Mycobacteriaceae bacterium]|nr:alpha/beta hydrolase [Mycobacteriaceae bacterium]